MFEGRKKKSDEIVFLDHRSSAYFNSLERIILILSKSSHVHALFLKVFRSSEEDQKPTQHSCSNNGRGERKT